MRKYSKKIALILVLALTLVTAVPALAAGSKTTVSGVYDEVTIEVTVPTTGSFVINPYRLPVEVKADDGTTVLGDLKTGGQIANQPLIGYNMSDFDMSIGATVKGTKQGAFTFATTAPSDTATTKTGLVYLQVANANYNIGVDTTATTDTTASGVNGVNALYALNKWTQPDKYNARDEDKLIVGTTEASKHGMCTVKAGTDSDTNGTIDAPSAKGYFMARLCGDVVQAPKTPWAESDGFTAEITWIFEPAT